MNIPFNQIVNSSSNQTPSVSPTVSFNAAIGDHLIAHRAETMGKEEALKFGTPALFDKAQQALQPAVPDLNSLVHRPDNVSTGRPLLPNGSNKMERDLEQLFNAAIHEKKPLAPFAASLKPHLQGNKLLLNGSYYTLNAAQMKEIMSSAGVLPFKTTNVTPSGPQTVGVGSMVEDIQKGLANNKGGVSGVPIVDALSGLFSRAKNPVEPTYEADHSKSDKTRGEFMALKEKLRQIPELKQARLSDEQLATIGLLSLFAGNSLAPNLLQGMIAGQQAFTDSENQKNVDAYNRVKQEAVVLEDIYKDEFDLEKTKADRKYVKDTAQYDILDRLRNAKTLAEQEQLGKKLSNRITNELKAGKIVVSVEHEEFNEAPPEKRLQIARELRTQGAREFKNLSEEALIAWAKQANPIGENSRRVKDRESLIDSIVGGDGQWTLNRAEVGRAIDSAQFIPAKDTHLKNQYISAQLTLRDELASFTGVPNEYKSDALSSINSRFKQVKLILNAELDRLRRGNVPKSDPRYRAISEQLSDLSEMRKSLESSMKGMKTPEMSRRPPSNLHGPIRQSQ